MKAFYALAIVPLVHANVLDVLKRAACNADNCARAVTGSNVNSQSRITTDCNSYVQPTSCPATVTTMKTSGSVATTITPTITCAASPQGDVPFYAKTACTGNSASRFSSACSCAGITRKSQATPTVTIVVPTPSTTTTPTTTTTKPTTTTTKPISTTAPTTTPTTTTTTTTTTPTTTTTTTTDATVPTGVCLAERDIDDIEDVEAPVQKRDHFNILRWITRRSPAAPSTTTQAPSTTTTKTTTVTTITATCLVDLKRRKMVMRDPLARVEARATPA